MKVGDSTMSPITGILLFWVVCYLFGELLFGDDDESR